VGAPMNAEDGDWPVSVWVPPVWARVPVAGLPAGGKASLKPKRPLTSCARILTERTLPE
jgi:hypothetical protein